MAKKLMVALTVFFVSQAKGGLVALLQGRGEISHEKVHFHSFPGTYQTTVFGKGEGGEEPMQALRREVAEELGSSVLLPWDQIIEVHVDENDDRKIVFYAVFVPEESVGAFFKSVSFNGSTGGFRWIMRDEVSQIQYVQPSHKMAGPMERGPTVMRQDEAQGLEPSFVAMEAQLAATRAS